MVFTLYFDNEGQWFNFATLSSLKYKPSAYIRLLSLLYIILVFAN